VLSLFATGRTTGTVLDSGEGVTHTVPIYEGYAIPHAITTIPICGRDLTDYMLKLLQAKDPTNPLNTTEDWQQAEDYKINYGHVALDFDAELKSAGEGSETYQLPNGGPKININKERLQCPELLFNPQNNNISDAKGIHNYTFDSIMKCDNDIKKDLFKNIVLAGGCTMFQGM
jgi:actin, other eukaryote